MIRAEGSTRLGRAIRNKLIWTGERAVARRVDRKLAAMKAEPTFHQETWSDGQFRVTSKSGYTLAEKKISIGGTFIDRELVNPVSPSGAIRDEFIVSTRTDRHSKPEIRIDRVSPADEDSGRLVDREPIAKWEDLSRKRRLELMKEHGLLPDPANLDSVKRRYAPEPHAVDAMAD